MAILGMSGSGEARRLALRQAREQRRPGMLLALDTSTKQAGIALYDAVLGLIAEYNWRSDNRHTEQLAFFAARLLEQAGVTPRNLRAVGVALGPGSFAGLRVGLSVAKGLALAHDLALVGVPTLDVVAYPHQVQPLPVAAFAQAGRGRVYWAAYGRGPEGWTALTPCALATVAQVAGRLGEPTLCVGELTSADQELLADLAGRDRVQFLPAVLSVRRAGVLAELAWARFSAGAADDPAALSPIYLPWPERNTQAERSAAAGV